MRFSQRFWEALVYTYNYMQFPIVRSQALENLDIIRVVKKYQYFSLNVKLEK